MVFEVPRAGACLFFTVWDDDRVNNDDLLGKMEIPLSQISPNHTTWQEVTNLLVL